MMMNPSVVSRAAILGGINVGLAEGKAADGLPSKCQNVADATGDQ
jgi:hypothetical protein